MTNSAEELHQGSINLKAGPGADLRLFIDLDICASGECRECTLQCSYFYHPGNNGIVSVAELAAYALVCRRCERPHCVAACPVEALARREDREGMLTRHNMRCIGCRSCSHACPYGTLYAENVPLLVHVCDFCLDRRRQPDEPLCIAGCAFGALALKRGDQTLPENTYFVGDHLIVHSTHWIREKA